MYASGISEVNEPFVDEIARLGCIEFMLIPEGWVKGKTVVGIRGASFFRDYHEAIEPSVQLTFYYRGYRIDQFAGQTFRAMLSAPKSISKEELQNCETIVGVVANPAEFLFDAAEVFALEGRNVLEVQGTYIKSNIKAKIVFIDGDDTGTAVREISYIAPVKLFDEFKDQADCALHSIVWNRKVEVQP
jgi:hypothetical protein